MLRISRFWHGGSPAPRIELHRQHIAHQSLRHFTKVNNTDQRVSWFPEGQRYCTIAQPDFIYVDSVRCEKSWENTPKPNGNLVYEKPSKHYFRDARHSFSDSGELPHAMIGTT
jgi:hypothetical protein